MIPASSCQSCGSTRVASRFIKLWDGKEYCVDCIQRESPALLEHAEAAETLAETISYPVVKLAVIWAFTFTVAWGSLWLIFPLISIIGGKKDFVESLQAWAFITGLGLPVIAVFAIAHACAYVLNRPTVSVAGGELTVRQRGKSETVTLSRCEWYVGRISQMNVLQNTAILRNPAIIIVLPHADGKDARNVAVGFTNETRQIWESFLTLSKSPHRANWPVTHRLPVLLANECIDPSVPRRLHRIHADWGRHIQDSGRVDR